MVEVGLRWDSEERPNVPRKQIEYIYIYIYIYIYC